MVRKIYNLLSDLSLMKACMIYPHISSEKGISKYSTDIIENVGKNGLNMDHITYMQGKPWTLIKQIFKIRKYDVIHLQHEYNLLGYFGLPYYFLFGFLGLFKRNSFITTMHTVLDPNENLEKNKLKGVLRKWFYYSKNWLIGKSSDIVVAHSYHFTDILEKNYNLEKRKIVMLPHAILENIKIYDKKKARRDLKIRGEKVFLMIGTMNPYHDYEAVVKVANEVDGKLLIVTSTSAVNYRDTDKLKEALVSLKKEINKNKVKGKVELRVGFVDYKDWWKYYSSADLVLLPYVGGVGSGIFSDAMAVEKPVIASNVPYFTSIAQRSDAVKIAEKNEDFAKVINESMKSKNYNKLLKGCLKYKRENGLTPVSKKYIEMYKALSK